MVAGPAWPGYRPDVPASASLPTLRASLLLAMAGLALLPAPALADSAIGDILLTAVNKVVNQDARWTYTYANNDVVAAGTFPHVRKAYTTAALRLRL